VSENTESTEPGRPDPGDQPDEPDQPDHSDQPDQARSRRQSKARVARASAAAATSRTAGWIVAAALGGSLVTLLLDGSLSQPAVRQVTISNAGRAAPAPGRTAPAPGSRQSWRVVAPGSPQTIYLGPGNGPGSPPAPGWVYLSPASPPGSVWMPAQPPMSWTAVPGCVMYRAVLPALPAGRLRGIRARVRRQVIIGRVAIGRPGKHARIRIAQRPTCGAIRVVPVPSHRKSS